MGERGANSNLIREKKITKLTNGVYYQNYINVGKYTFFEDGNAIVKKYTNAEFKVAKWYQTIFKEQVILLPKVNKPENISSPDYLIKGEKWDLKSLTSNKNNAIYTRMRNNESQANNYIIDIGKSKLTIKATIKQVKELHSSKYFKWLNKIVIKKNKNYIVISRQK